METSNELNLLVTSKVEVADGIKEFRFADSCGGPLPEFDPGSHIAVLTPSGANRQYSLINSGKQPIYYQIAVKLEHKSRGGSSSLHNELGEGDSIIIQHPNNSFPLVEASDYLFIGGGIGITPLISMASCCQENSKKFRLIYCARSEQTAAYVEEIRNICGENAIIHFDGGDPAKAYDFWDEFMTPGSTHVYCCGPKPLMEEVEALSGHWPEEQIHFEDFNPQDGLDHVNETFSVSIRSRGKSFEISENSTILETLRHNGIRVPSSCESGTCGSCKMKLLAGEVDHRDFVLESDEYGSSIMVCVSRGKGNIEIDFDDY